LSLPARLMHDGVPVRAQAQLTRDEREVVPERLRVHKRAREESLDQEAFAKDLRCEPPHRSLLTEHEIRVCGIRPVVPYLTWLSRLAQLWFASTRRPSCAAGSILAGGSSPLGTVARVGFRSRGLCHTGGHPDGGRVHSIRKPATAIGTVLFLRHVLLPAVDSA